MRSGDSPLTDNPRQIKGHILFLGVVLVAINSYWALMGSEVWHSTQLTIASLFFNAVFTLLVLVLINLPLKRFAPRLALSQADLLTLYTMVVMVTTISGHTMMGYLLPVIEHAFWYASPENEWEQLFGAHVPDWIAIKDKEALRGFFQGDSNLYTPTNLIPWIQPVVAWSLFVIALWLVLLSLTIFLRKQWTENEKLSYPIVQLPIAMTTDPVAFFTNRWMWIGFGIVAVLDLINGLHYITPTVPYLNIKNQTLFQFSANPWRAMGPFRISFYPFVIGLMFFTPLDLSFSCWFFYLFGRGLRIMGAAVGLQTVYPFEQSVGAWVALGMIPIWMGRKFYLQVIRRIVGLPGQVTDDDEPMRYRTAASLGMLGLTFLVFFCQQAGMTLWAIALFFAIYFPMVIAITRSRAEIGPPVHTLIYVDPGRTMVTTLGTRRLGIPNLTILTYLYPLNRCFRANPMPSELEALRIAERTNIGYRQVLTGVILTIVFGIFFTFWVYIHMMYDLGVNSKARGWIRTMGWEFFNRLQNWLVHPREPNVGELVGIGGGFGFTVFLMVMKIRFLWWPFHPGGYVLTTGGGLGREWFAVFLSWLAKFIILRAGGVKLYRQAVPFFLGLILGDYTLGCIWSIVGIVFQMPTYGVWH